MNIRTEVTAVSIGDGIRQSTLVSEINNKIQERESEGWHLRGTPVYIKEVKAIMLTFETPETDDSEGKESEPVPPMITPERFYELMNKGRADSK